MATGAGLSLAQIKDAVLFETGTVASDFVSELFTDGDDHLTLICNKSWWEIMDRFDFREKEGFSDFVTVDGTASYTIATEVDPVVFDALRNVSIENPNTNRFENLEEISLHRYQSLYTTDETQENIPTQYMRDSGLIYFYPIPDDEYTIRLHHLQILADLPSEGPQVPQPWHEIIERGAIYRAYLALRDYNSARIVRADQILMIDSIATNVSKENKEQKFNGVQVPTRNMGRRY